MAISSIGIGSNLPIDAIIEGLMNAERRPLDLVGQQKAGYQAQVSAYGTLKSALASFQSAVAKLADTG
jgi:flagellar hook-associated protein 2